MDGGAEKIGWDGWDGLLHWGKHERADKVGWEDGIYRQVYKVHLNR